MSITHLARPEIRALKAYQAAIQVDQTVRLNANEAPWKNGRDHFRRPLNRYPEIRPESLRTRLAAHYGCGRENLLVTRGSSEAIDLLIRVFCRSGKDQVVVPSPTFSMYRHYAEIQGASVLEVPRDPENDFAINLDALIDSCSDTTKLVFVCTPNNPTGTPFDLASLERLLNALAGRCAVVVDEAYIEFAQTDSAVGLLERHANLFVLRTLSKALAFAGARCGAIIGPAESIDMVNAVQAPYALSTPVIECVENVLEGSSLAEARLWAETIVAERERVAASLQKFQFVRYVWPSAANFLLVMADDAVALMQATSNARVLLRFFGDELPDCVRISIGSPAENDRLLDVLADFSGNTA
jgi:histidinol-phosphate aminotransferase